MFGDNDCRALASGTRAPVESPCDATVRRTCRRTARSPRRPAPDQGDIHRRGSCAIGGSLRGELTPARRSTCRHRPDDARATSSQPVPLSGTGKSAPPTSCGGARPSPGSCSKRRCSRLQGDYPLPDPSRWDFSELNRARSRRRGSATPLLARQLGLKRATTLRTGLCVSRRAVTVVDRHAAT
jgi:hypothetical protein